MVRAAARDSNDGDNRTQRTPEAHGHHTIGQQSAPRRPGRLRRLLRSEAKAARAYPEPAPQHSMIGAVLTRAVRSPTERKKCNKHPLPRPRARVLLFINLSPLTLDLDSEAPAWLGAAVERAGLRPQDVVIEVTERFGGRTASVIKRLKQLRQQGFQVAIDDVGTGNSGLEILRGIEAEFVKLDRSIVVTAPAEPGARAVLMAMATFARQTGAFVIAEALRTRTRSTSSAESTTEISPLQRSFKAGRAMALADRHRTSHQSRPRCFMTGESCR
jgi:predicted signal transduction protein with EAL and GGDEF domain